MKEEGIIRRERKKEREKRIKIEEEFESSVNFEVIRVGRRGVFILID